MCDEKITFIFKFRDLYMFDFRIFVYVMLAHIYACYCNIFELIFNFRTYIN